MKNLTKRTSLLVILFAIFFVNSVNVYSQTWSLLGSGMENRVNQLIVYNNELIAGGQFLTAGGDTAKRIAKWNGTNWAPLGSGITGSPGIVMSLLAYNNELYAGGQFTSTGGSSANYIAIWNGSN